MPQRALNKYKENSITSATPEELTMMLYNGSLKFMNIGKDAIEKNDFQRKNDALLRAQQIVTELQASLNMDYEISEEMDALYRFINEKLMEANINKSTKEIDEAMEIMMGMRDAWREVIKQIRQKSY